MMCQCRFTGRSQMHGSGAGVDPGGGCARGAGVYGNSLYFLLSFWESKAALKNKVYLKKGRSEEEEYALFFFFFTNWLFLGTIVYMFMESMFSPLTCSIFNSAEIRGLPAPEVQKGSSNNGKAVMI